MLQWNVNGFYNTLDEVKLLINSQNLDILCPQETNLAQNSTPLIKGYQSFTKNRLNCSRASGGVVILTSLTYPAHKIPIVSQVIAIRFKAKENFTICNIYLPNLTNFNQNDI